MPIWQAPGRVGHGRIPRWLPRGRRRADGVETPRVGGRFSASVSVPGGGALGRGAPGRPAGFDAWTGEPARAGRSPDRRDEVSRRPCPAGAAPDGPPGRIRARDPLPILASGRHRPTCRAGSGSTGAGPFGKVGGFPPGVPSLPVQGTLPEMIRGFRHRAPGRLYGRGDRSRVTAELAQRLAMAPADLDDAVRPTDLDPVGCHRPPGGRSHVHVDPSPPRPRHPGELPDPAGPERHRSRPGPRGHPSHPLPRPERPRGDLAGNGHPPGEGRVVECRVLAPPPGQL